MRLSMTRNRRLQINIYGLSLHEETALRELLYQVVQKYENKQSGWVCLYVDTDVERNPRILVNEVRPVSTGMFLPDTIKQTTNLDSPSTVCIDSDYSFTWETYKK